jgi:hypothetical protein
MVGALIEPRRGAEEHNGNGNDQIALSKLLGKIKDNDQDDGAHQRIIQSRTFDCSEVF